MKRVIKEMKKVKEMKEVNLKKLSRVGVVSCFSLISVALLCACTGSPRDYSPSDFVNANRIVTQTVEKPVLPQVNATYGIGNDPAVVKAYETYQKSGEMQTIKSEGWITYPYSTESKPIIACSMFHFCIVQLESGEKLNSYGLGDTHNWQVNAFITGEGKEASISIQVKPVMNSLSTDLTISTNKRTYLIGLVASQNADTTVLRFYYPEETMIDNLRQANAMQQSNGLDQIISQTPLTGETHIDINHLNFNYEIKGDTPPWRPLRIFDDSNKTYIEMPAIASRFSLPVLYIARHKEMQMVNYRYEQPYFVVDGLFSRAWLVSGKGNDQVKVEIINPSIQE